MRFGLVLASSVSVVLSACGGVSLEDAPATNPAPPAQCAPSTCGKCPDDTVSRATCSSGTLRCACEPSGTGTCTAAPACSPGDSRIPSPSACPVGATCYSQTTCGSTIYCATSTPQCDAIPTCEPGDEQVAPPACASGTGCYERTMCGTTILCKRTEVFPADASKLVATDDGGGLVPQPPPGSTCKMGQAEYTFTTALGHLTWKVCNTNVAPYALSTGGKSLSPTDAQSLEAVAAQLQISSSANCGDDKSIRKVAITSLSNGTREYLDSFYACDGAGMYVDGIDALFAALAAHTK